MNIGILITLITLVVGCFSASIGTEAVEKKQCLDERDPQFRLNVGQQGAGPRGTCMLVKCEDVVDGKPVVTAIGCGVFVLSAGCNGTDYDNTKPYPDCCPSEVC